MKRLVNGEKGYALVVVLLIITLIGIIAVPLIGSAISSANQNQKSEEMNQTSKIADMGITYFRHLGEEMGDLLLQDINEQMKNIEEHELEAFLQSYRTEIEKFLKDEDYVPSYLESIEHLHPKKIKVGDFYYFSFDDIAVELKHVISSTNEKKYYYEINYTSIGEKETEDGTKEKRKKDKMMIALDSFDEEESGENGDGEDPPFEFPPQPDGCINNNDIIINNSNTKNNSNKNNNNNKNNPNNPASLIRDPINSDICFDMNAELARFTEATINGTLYVTKDLNLLGGSPGKRKGILTIKDDLIVKGQLTLHTHSELIVENGNAYIQNIHLFPNANITIKNGNLYLFGPIDEKEIKSPICVFGTLYTKQQLDNVTVNPYMTSCPKSSKGIYVKALEFVE